MKLINRTDVKLSSKKRKTIKSILKDYVEYEIGKNSQFCMMRFNDFKIDGVNFGKVALVATHKSIILGKV